MQAHDSDVPALKRPQPPARAVPESGYRAGDPAAILRLQRSAGNAAVTHRITRERQAGSPAAVQRMVVLNGRVYSNDAARIPDETTANSLWAEVETAGNALPAVEQYLFTAHQDEVRQQLVKWVDDRGSGTTGGKHHAVFGRKAQHHNYPTASDLVRGLLGWVKQKAGRRQEKALAKRVYANDDIGLHLDVVLAKVKNWIDKPDHAAKAADIYEELRTSTVQGDAYGTYQTHLDAHANAAAHTTINKNVEEVLNHPEKYTVRDKVVVLHDLMEYFSKARHRRKETAGDDMLAPAGVDKYQSTLAIDASGKRVTSTDSRGMHVDKPRVITTRDESDETTKLARKHNVPVWVGQSFTTANMLNLAQQTGATKRELGAVAWAVFAFWRLDFDHTTQLGYHTLHEVMDIAQNFEVPYSMLNRGAGLDAYSGLLTSMNTTVKKLVSELASLRIAATAHDKAHAELNGGTTPLTDLCVKLHGKIEEATQPLLGLTTKSQPKQQEALRLYALSLQEALSIYQVLCGFIGQDPSTVNPEWAAQPA